MLWEFLLFKALNSYSVEWKHFKVLSCIQTNLCESQTEGTGINQIIRTSDRSHTDENWNWFSWNQPFMLDLCYVYLRSTAGKRLHVDGLRMQASLTWTPGLTGVRGYIWGKQTGCPYTVWGGGTTMEGLGWPWGRGGVGVLAGLG